MSLGRILLLAVSVLVLFGVGQRVLDKMRLTDRQALFFMALILVGGWIPSIPLSGSVRVNIGGALVPLGLCIYLFVRAGTARERWRAGIASALSAAAVLGLGMLLPDEPEAMPFDINYAYGLLAGAIVHALALMQQKGITDKIIYSDSVNAQLWVSKKQCKTKLERTPQTEQLYQVIARAENWLRTHPINIPIIKWETKKWGEIPADFGRKG